MELKVHPRNDIYLPQILIERTSQGWYVSTGSRRGECYKNGKLIPGQGHESLFDILDRHGDSISYPSDLGIYMEMLWERAEELKMNDDEIQKNLDVLSEWIQKVEDGKPDSSWEFSGWSNLNPGDASKYS